jgi:hypothetical protein
MKNVSDNVVEKNQNTHFMFNFFLENHVFYDIMLKEYDEIVQVTDDITQRVRFA